MSGPFRETAAAVAVTGGTDIASGEPLNTTATDKITTAAEAAQFLRQAALGGGTWQEIQNVLAMGSRKKWLEEQIFTPDYFRANPVWNVVDPTLPAPGYFSNVCRTLFPPRANSAETTFPNFIFSGETTTIRCLLTAFVNNACMDVDAADIQNAVASVDGDQGGSLLGATGYDLLETLRLKCTWILNKLIPVSVPGGAWDAPDKATSICFWYSILHRHAFGKYADLLEEVTYAPPMSNMLTYVANRKEANGFQPDENYAREIMQLFTIGLYELNIDGSYKLDASGNRINTYDNEDVYQMARVFTGLCRMDFADFDPQRVPANQDFSWHSQAGPGTWQYEIEDADRIRDMSNTGVFYMHPYCSYDGNTEYTVGGVRQQLKYLSTTITQAIPASGSVTTINVASTTNWPRQGQIIIDDEIFHYLNNVGDTGVFRVFPAGPEYTYFRGHEMSLVQAHSVGATVRFWKPYWYAPGVSARLRHYIPFYEKGAKYALKGLVNIPANTEPRKNIRMAIEALVAHPSTAPFVATSLIKHMVTSNPSRGYVARVARVFENDGQGVRGNLGAVWMAILTDPEACNTAQSSPGFGRIRDGFEAWVATVRPFHRVSRGRPGVAATSEAAIYVNGVHRTGLSSGFINTWGDIKGVGVWPYFSPSIFSYYPPTYSVTPGAGWGLITPELGAYSFYTLMEFTHQVQNRISQGEPRDVQRANVTVSIGSPAVVTWTGHTLSNGTQVAFTTTGSLPTGLNTTTTYFVVNAVAGVSVQLSLTSGGPAINTSGTQSPTHTLWTGIMSNADLTAASYTLVTSTYDNTVSATASNADLLERLNLLLCGGTLSASKKFGLEQVMSTDVSTDAARQNRITGTIQLLCYTPEFFVQ